MNPPERPPFLAWPGWAHLRFAWLLTALTSLWFAAVFIGADWITAHRSLRIRVHLEAELQLPLIPSFTLVYMSIYLLFLVAPFVLRTRVEISRLAMAQSLSIFIAGITFLLLPAQLAFAPPTDSDLGIWKGLFRFADWLNLDYNLVPSLHVALGILCIETFAVHAPVLGRLLLRLWGMVIAVAVVLIHQHHVLDAVTGYLLALGVLAIFKRWEH